MAQYHRLQRERLFTAVNSLLLVYCGTSIGIHLQPSRVTHHGVLVHFLVSQKIVAFAGALMDGSQGL